MQNLQYIYSVGKLDDWTKNAGSRNKVSAQVKALNQNGLPSVVLMKPMLSKWIRMLPFQSSNSDWDHICLPPEATAIYIRYNASSMPFLRFLKKQKCQYPQRKILIEFPTYPYDQEPMNILKKARDRFYRKFIHKYVDRCVLMSSDKEVFGIKSIQIDNGIDCDEIHQRTPILHEGNTVRLLAVATVANWHGYDRVIRGLGEYYAESPKRNVELHLVGGGRLIPELKQLCVECGVENYVYFHGWKKGEDLGKLFDQCDMGVGCLGVHRKDITYTNSLKLREYAARGIPFFYGDIDLAMEEHFKEYLMNVPANDDPIVISDIIRFYNEMKEKGFDKIAVEMHGLAERNLSWTKQLKPVVDYILSDDAESIQSEG